MTLAELKARTLARVAEAGAPVAHTAAEVTDALNEGLRLFALLTLCVERRGFLPLDGGVAWYRLFDYFSDWLLPLRVRVETTVSGAALGLWDSELWDAATFDQAATTLAGTTLVRPARVFELDARNPSWQTDQRNPVERYGTCGAELLFVWPQPAASAIARLWITYAAVPAELVLDGDIPEIPERYHSDLIDFAVCTLALKDGAQELERALPQLAKFLAAAETLAEVVRGRNRANRYDAEPFELKAYDRSRLITAMKKPRQAA